MNYFHFHRHLTHSLVFSPILAALVVGVVRLAGRKPLPLIPAFLIALIGIGSHLLLDLTNAYGVRLLLPFSGKWLRLDLTNIFDFWIWSVFAVCLAGPFLSNLVGGEIGGVQKRRFPGRGFAWLALIFLLAYDGGRWVLHARAIAMLDSRIYRETAPIRVAAFPEGSNPVQWKGVAETDSAYFVFDMNVLRPFDPMQGQTLFKAESSIFTEAAARTKPFQIFRDFAQYPLWRVIPADSTDGSMQVILSDIRFPFLCSAIVDRTGAVRSSAFLFGR